MSLYLMEATTLHHSRDLVGLKLSISDFKIDLISLLVSSSNMEAKSQRLSLETPSKYG